MSSNWRRRMLSRETIEKKTLKLVSDHLDRDAKLSDKLEDDLGADSLDNVELVMSVEEEFDIEISDEQAYDVSTVKDLVDLVEKALA